MDGLTVEVAVEKPQFSDPPTQPDPLAREWHNRIERAAKDQKKFHERIKHNRNLVSGFDWSKTPTSGEFYGKRANLILGAISTLQPALYARNPEISVVPRQVNPPGDLKLLCKTMETVTNRLLVDAGLKDKAKRTLTAALTCSFGVLKVMYQRDMEGAPIIQDRMEDAQDNLARVEGLMRELNDDRGRSDEEARKEELMQTIQGLQEKVEVPAAEGVVIDRVLTEHILVDPAIVEFADYPNAAWIAQLIPMRKKDAEALFGFRLDAASTYKIGDEESGGVRLQSGGNTSSGDDDRQVLIVEIWDKQSQRVYTMAKGCQFWLRDPYSPPKVGERWFPFFLLPYTTVDGQFVGPSLVDLMERLEKEHNDTRDKYNEHRELYKPGWIANANVDEKSISRFGNSELGEITMINVDVPLQQAIMPRVTTQFDPAAYDLTAIRSDIEQVTGLQDAMRSSVVTAKTATEARIQQQSLSGRVSELRDMIEAFCQEIAEYVAQMALMELDEVRVEKIMGPHKTEMVQMVDPLTMMTTMQPQVVELSYDWPQMDRAGIFDMLELQVRAGTSGKPDSMERRESWGMVLPELKNTIMQIIQVRATGGDAAPLEELLKKTVELFDDSMEVASLIPQHQPQQPAMPTQPDPMMGGQQGFM